MRQLCFINYFAIPHYYEYYVLSMLFWLLRFFFRGMWVWGSAYIRWYSWRRNTWITVTEYLCRKWPRLWSLSYASCNHFLIMKSLYYTTSYDFYQLHTHRWLYNCTSICNLQMWNRYELTELLLKVALNTITLTLNCGIVASNIRRTISVLTQTKNKHKKYHIVTTEKNSRIRRNWYPWHTITGTSMTKWWC